MLLAHACFATVSLTIRLLRHCIAHNTLALPLQALCSDNLFLTKLCKYKHTSNP